MADETEPESKPITVSELIARSGGDDAFPRSESVSVRRAGTTASSTTASGMPSYTAPSPAPDAPRAVGASGMPGFTPPVRSDVESTGVIPAFSDDDTGSLRKVEADDMFDYDLPPAVIHQSTYDSTDALTVAAPVDPEPASSFDDTTSIPLVDDTDTDVDAGEHILADDTRGDDVRADETVAHELLSEGSDDKAAAKAAKAKADRKAAKAEAKAAKAAEDDDAEPSAALGWAAFVGEIVVGLGVGAGLFWGFTELWKRYVYLALVLAIVVIFAVVTFAHILRKRDLATTLLALAVGMLVTIGPLVFLAAQP
ncbi:hypothetical protein nbrc107696_00990 [Gordonia spumicola]|uniref:Transmembrane protein n=1 Tax=Gordonia spumicola TaxID=589161 RepID=A0A7I9V374_9ACTN|nr:hypothetical protein [Gordonia spumicola]GED99652.1 hypothetical protein nbrc107696_00990 [Gordonia spumicola]